MGGGGGGGAKSDFVGGGAQGGTGGGQMPPSLYVKKGPDSKSKTMTQKLPSRVFILHIHVCSLFYLAILYKKFSKEIYNKL